MTLNTKHQKVMILSALTTLAILAGCANSETLNEEDSYTEGDNSNESGEIVVGGTCNKSNYLTTCSVDGEVVQCNGGHYYFIKSCEEGEVCVNGTCEASSGNNNGESGGSSGGENGGGSDPKPDVCAGVSYTCMKPAELTLNTEVMVKSVCGSSEHEGAKCKKRVENTTGSEAVIHLNIAQTGYYDFSFTNLGANEWSIYASTACDSEDMVMGDWCSSGSDSFTLTSKLMNAGDHYFFIESSDDEATTAHVGVKYNMSSNQNALACISSSEIETSGGAIIDLSDKSATLTFSGKTSMGTKLRTSAAGKSISGKEVIYAFHLDQAAKVKAVLTNITPETDRKNLDKIYLFVAECDTAGVMSSNVGTIDSHNIAQLAYSSETSQVLTLVSGETFEPGTYNLGIASSNTYDFSFDLSFSLVTE